MKKVFNKYLSRFSILFIYGFCLLISCKETNENQQVIIRKKPTIIRQKIAYAAQSEPIATAQIESSVSSSSPLTSISPIKKKGQSFATEHIEPSISNSSPLASVTSTKKEFLQKGQSLKKEGGTSFKQHDLEKQSQKSVFPKEKVVASINKKESSNSLSTTEENEMTLILKKLAPKPFKYRPQGKIDPFVPLIVKKKRVLDTSQPAKKTVRKKRKRILTLLEKFDLSQLKLTAVMITPKSSVAIVEESTGRGFVVKAGTRIGLNSGRVVDILMDRIIIQEYEEIITGKKLYITREMKLNKPDSEF